jgi:hypothetical protein
MTSVLNLALPYFFNQAVHILLRLSDALTLHLISEQDGWAMTLQA